jgi:hypothetical protein
MGKQERISADAFQQVDEASRHTGLISTPVGYTPGTAKIPVADKNTCCKCDTRCAKRCAKMLQMLLFSLSAELTGKGVPGNAQVTGKVLGRHLFEQVRVQLLQVVYPAVH